ncbi:MAG: 30S ribosomal protein S21 [Nitrososphaeraceae archaeon]
MPKVTLTPERQTPKDIDKALRNLKKIMEREGIIKKYFENEQYETPSAKRVRKKAAAVMRQKREQKNNSLPTKRSR